MRPEDILPGDQNHAQRDGLNIRKGTVAAFLANAGIWCDPAAGASQRQAAERDIRELLPSLRALGLFEVLSIRDAALRRRVDEWSSACTDAVRTFDD